MGIVCERALQIDRVRGHMENAHALLHMQGTAEKKPVYRRIIDAVPYTGDSSVHYIVVQSKHLGLINGCHYAYGCRRRFAHFQNDSQ